MQALRLGRIDVQELLLNTLLTKTTASQNAVALNYHKVRGLYFVAVIFAATIDERPYHSYGILMFLLFIDQAKFIINARTILRQI